MPTPKGLTIEFARLEVSLAPQFFLKHKLKRPYSFGHFTLSLPPNKEAVEGKPNQTKLSGCRLSYTCYSTTIALLEGGRLDGTNHIDISLLTPRLFSPLAPPLAPFLATGWGSPTVAHMYFATEFCLHMDSKQKYQEIYTAF